ncbi:MULTISPECIES: hypothetical protein [unclassified Caulobacter]|uniref:hypothetical protein n=1 Tax=unclassified Caulobacter TaxID=2648921 RepID=UPI000D362DC1|nr:MULTISPECIES: hypothetical protein [unclassified Caulobacter]PTS87484.1 hypothetical protein DBR21_12450 [Caulobacter sp. HMWF009]PTT06414.1 hypothetical protein DBR10_12705 [Caulobacter sp. HMWF025]
MRTDSIKEIGIDAEGRLYIEPRSSTFPFVYLEAMQVGWDSDLRRLFSPKPTEWSYVDWFRQLTEAAVLQGVRLRLSGSTRWRNIDPSVRQQIKAEERGSRPAGWYVACCAGGLASGFLAGLLALLVSGHLYEMGLPDPLTIWVSLPVIPTLAYVPLYLRARWFKPLPRIVGSIAFLAFATAGLFALLVLVARADAGI